MPNTALRIEDIVPIRNAYVAARKDKRSDAQ